jgi:hypothetical protein
MPDVEDKLRAGRYSARNCTASLVIGGSPVGGNSTPSPGGWSS